MRCILDAADLGQRGEEIARLLRPIAPPAQRLSCRPRFIDRQFMLLSAHLGEQPTAMDPDDWRFPTRVPRIRASYYERWIPTNQQKHTYYLDRAYLHLFIRTEDDEPEILALHCDPALQASSQHFRYKAGPHMHMSTAGDPLKHTHIALNLDNLDEVLRSVKGITAALKTAVEMVHDQVLLLF